jgi:sulfate-transporting ATPase
LDAEGNGVTIVQFVLLGFATAGIYALLGQSIVMVHAGSKVLNFASTAMGLFGTFVFYKMWDDGNGLWWPLCLVIACLVACALGVFVHFAVMNPLRRSSPTSRIVASLGVFVALTGLETILFAPAGAVLSVNSILSTNNLRMGSISVGWNQIDIALIAIAITVVLFVFSTRTRIGLAVKAVAENSVVTASLGWSPNKLAAISWAGGSLVATIALILAAPLTGLNVSSLSLFVIPAMAAALVGKFEYFWWTLIGGFVIGCGESLSTRYISAPGWSGALPLILIVAVLMFRGKALPSKADSAWTLPGVGSGRRGIAFWVWIVLGILAITFVSSNWLSSVAVLLVVAMIILSVVIVTGYAGQLSLAQFALAGVGAYATAWFVIEASMPVWAAILLGALVTVPVGLVFALAAFRTRGSDLAIVTLALATVVVQLLLQNSQTITSISEGTMPGLSIFGLQFDELGHPRAYAFLLFAIFLLCAVVATNLRRGSVGRRLLAVRANERASAALGISVPVVKAYSFALAAFIAALAGGLAESQFIYANFTEFSEMNSINAVLQAVVGGIGWVSGAIVGAFGSQGGPLTQALASVSGGSSWLEVAMGVGVVLVVLQSPTGIVSANIHQFRVIYRRVSPTHFEAKVARERKRLYAEAALYSKSDESPADSAETVVSGGAVGSLVVKNVRVEFGGQVALDDVSLEIAPGEVVGLIGPNGAGKSTLIDVICGFQKVAGGSVSIGERSLDSVSPSKRVGFGLGRSFQSLELFEDMTVLDNLRVASDKVNAGRYVGDLVYPRNSRASQLTIDAVSRFGLRDVLHLLPHELDYAHRRLVAIARVLASGARVMFLDEPAAGLDEKERLALGDMVIRSARTGGVGVLLVEHDVEFVFRVCDRVVLLDAGVVIAHGTAQEMRRNPLLAAAYLGTAPEEEALAIEGGER